MDIYYESDQVVEGDQELQDFVKDVYMYGMRGKKASGRDVPLPRPQPSLLLFPFFGPCWPVASTLAPGTGARAPRGPLSTSMPQGDISGPFCVS